MRRTREILTGLASLLTLLAVEFGIPVGGGAALVILAPSLGVAHPADLLSPHSASTVLVLSLAAAATLGWLMFTVSLLIECVARARRVPTPRLPGFGGAQRGAASLVAGILLLLPTSGAVLAAQTPAHAVPAAASVSSTANPGGMQLAADATAVSQTRTSATATYTVQPTDNLWDIAQRILGDGAKWRQIADMNHGRYFDGHLFDADEPLQDGWQLTVPATSQTATADSASSTVVETQHLVHQGDNLWDIAKADYGDGARYTEIFKANEGHAQPHGLPAVTDPDLIIPGQELTIPQPATADPTTHQGTTTGGTGTTTAPTSGATTAPTTGSTHQNTDTGGTSATPTTGATQQNTGTSAASATPTPGATSSATAGASASASPTGPATTAPTARPSTTQASPSAPATRTGAPVHVGAGASASTEGEELALYILGGTLVTGIVLLTALGTRRRLQQRSRGRSELIALPRGKKAAEFETKVRAGHDPDGARAIAAALRVIAADAAQRNQPLPELAAVLYHPGSHLELRLARSAELPEPFVSIEESTKWWSCELADVRLDAAANQPAPYPALTALGVNGAGANILIDLENPKALKLIGQPEHTTSVLRRLVLDLAGSTFADHLSILLVADAPLLAGEIPGDRITEYQDLDEALTDLEQAASAAVNLLEAAGANSIRETRPTASVPEAEPTYLLLTDMPLSEEQQQRLTGVLEGSAAAPAAAIITAGDEDALEGVRGWNVPVGVGAVRVPGAGETLTVPGLDDPTHELLTDLLVTATDAGAVADPDWAEALDAALMSSGAGSGGSVATLVRPAAGQEVRVFQRPAWAVPAQSDPASPEIVLVPAAEGGADTVNGALNGIFTGLSALPELEESDEDDEEEPEEQDGGDPGEQDQSDSDEAAAPVAPEAEQQETVGAAGPRVLLLGPVEVVGRTGTEQRGRELRLTEMAAYLVLNPDGGHNAMAAALWPDSDHDRHSELSRLRTWLGKGEDGTWFLPHRSYRFVGVSSDWTDFLAHVKAGRLHAALSLVRDQPMLGTPPRRYGWAEYERQDMISRIADVAVALAENELQAGEYEAARSAAMAGLRVSPENEKLSCLAMDALLGARRRGEAMEIADAVVELCDKLGVDPQDETWETIRRVRGLQGAAT